LGIVQPGDEDYGDVAGQAVFLKRGYNVKTAHVGHDNVQQNQIGCVLARGLNAGCAILFHIQGVVVGQYVGKRDNVKRRIVNNKNVVFYCFHE
jgi:hypothetical protein